MKLEIVNNECGSTLLRLDNEQIIPSLGDEVCIKDKWYKITDRTFFYNEDGVTAHLMADEIELEVTIAEVNFSSKEELNNWWE